MIPIFEPNLTDLEKKYLFQAYDEGWISSQGRFINEFENKFAEKFDRKYGVDGPSNKLYIEEYFI